MIPWLDGSRTCGSMYSVALLVHFDTSYRGISIYGSFYLPLGIFSGLILIPKLFQPDDQRRFLDQLPIPCGERRHVGKSQSCMRGERRDRSVFLLSVGRISSSITRQMQRCRWFHGRMVHGRKSGWIRAWSIYLFTIQAYAELLPNADGDSWACLAVFIVITIVARSWELIKQI